MAGLGVRSLGGYTGDTLGATEQLAECAVLLVLAGALR
jgi:cobalamin synthase